MIWNEIFVYDETSPSGVRWAAGRSNNVCIGDVAGALRPDGYWKVKYLGKPYYAHRVVWEMRHGDIPEGKQIDHLDGNPSNNSISNLRLASRYENMHNMKLSRVNTSGVKGLEFNKKNGKWQGQVSLHGKRRYFLSHHRAEVEAWIIETRSQLHGDFVNHG